MDRKKRIVWHSNFCANKTGFGRHSRSILTYLYKTGKYDICEFATGINWSNPETQRVPWKCHGVLPDNQQEVSYLVKDGLVDQNLARAVHYGAHHIDSVIKEHQPDIYVATEDIWAYDNYWNKKWWDKISSILHTTLDSLPILKQAVDAAPKIKNYFVWAKFAEEALHKLGHKHVKTLHGAIDTDMFHRLSDEKRDDLRKVQNLSKKAFIVGFVFRNQLRKSVDKLLHGFKMFLDENPKTDAYLLLHTFWEEGWRIKDFMNEYQVPEEKVLTTYVCRRCRNYEVKPFTTPDTDCRFCGFKTNPNATNFQERTGQITTSPSFGVTESQLNEIYNLMDVYAHPFTSGGQEIPVQEAKLTELITLVTDYACGTEYCTPESGGIPLSWSEYREADTQFIKAATHPESVKDGINKVWAMSKEDRAQMGKTARQFVVDNCSVEVVGKFLEQFFDSLPLVEWDFDFSEPPKNPDYPMPMNVESDEEWLRDIYKNILLMNPPDDLGLNNWLQSITNGMTREQIYDYFVWAARQENLKNQQGKLEDLFDKDDEGKRLLIVQPESIGDVYLLTALFRSAKETYPNYNLYVATKPEYFEILEGNSFIHKVIPYLPIMENELQMEGAGDHKGVVEVCFLPFITTQRILNYLRNGKDNVAFDLKHHSMHPRSNCLCT